MVTPSGILDAGMVVPLAAAGLAVGVLLAGLLATGFGVAGFAAGAFDSMTYLLFDLCSLCLSVWFFAKCHGFFSKKEEQA